MTTKCLFHPTEAITNFCRNPGCLLPMCPSCVKLHSLEHMRSNTHGLYDSIIDMQAEVQGTLKKTLSQLIDSGDQLREVYERRRGEKRGLEDRLRQVRGRVMEAVGRYLDGVEARVMECVAGLEAGLDDAMNEADAKIERLSREAEAEVLTLNSQKQMKAIISHVSTNMPTYYDLKLNEISNLIQQINTTRLSYQSELRAPDFNEALKIIGECYRQAFIDPLSKGAAYRPQNQGLHFWEINKSISTECSAKKIV